MSQLLCFNPHLTVYSFDGATPRPLLVCELPTQQSDSPVRYLVPAELVGLLKQFDGFTGTDEIISRYVASHAQHSAEKLSSLVHDYCVPKGFLLLEGAEFNPELASGKRRSYMYLKKTLLPAHIVSWLSRPVSRLFQWKIILALLPVFIATQIIYFTKVFSKYHFSLNNVTGLDFALLMLITSFLGLLHELGHAAALNHFGYRRTTIGWGLYLSLTVFYADLSDAWKLKRLERSLVDLGGIYFHCITLTLLLPFLLCFHIPALAFSFLFVDLQIAGALNPFLRMDGYWLVSDLFGIADLRRECKMVFEKGLWRVLGKEDGSQTQLSHLSRRNRIFLASYIGAAIAFSGYLYQVLFVQIAFGILPAYPKLLLAFGGMVVANPLHVLVLLNVAGAIIFRGFMIYGFFRMIYGAIRLLLKWAARIVRTYRNAGQTVSLEVR
jgi:putative peptide zinc metalloprotease protein